MTRASPGRHADDERRPGAGGLTISLEQVLLLAVFLLAPLIERLMRGARQAQTGDDTGGSPRAPRPAAPPARPRTAPEAPPPSKKRRPEVPEAARPASVALTVAAAVPATVGTPRRRARKPGVVVGLGNREGLRRAIVLAAVLGPCRAVDPYGGRERDR